MFIEGLMFVAAVIGVIATLFYTPVIFCKTIFELEYGCDLSNAERRDTKIPIWNIWKAEKLYRGFGFTGLFEILTIVAIILRLVCFSFFREVGLLTLITVVFLLLSFGLSILANMLFVFTILRDAKVNTLGSCILLAVLYPVGQYYVGTFLRTVIKNMEKEEEVF